MKKLMFMLIISLMVLLHACTEVSMEYLKIKLEPGMDTIEMHDPFIDAGATASYGLKKLEITVIYNNVDPSTIGVYEIVYQATHRDLVQTIKRIVTVVDETPPVVTLNPGIDTITTSEAWVDAGITATDNSLDDLIINVIGEVLPVQGVYTILYQVTDPSGNQTSVTRYVHVIE